MSHSGSRGRDRALILLACRLDPLLRFAHSLKSLACGFRRSYRSTEVLDPM
jgi:hypothetical protein